MFERGCGGWAGLRLLGLLIGLMVGGGCGAKNGTMRELLRPIFPPTPSEAAREAFDINDPDKRRQSVALLSSAKFGSEAPYVRMYQLLMDDPDATVRAGCVRALGNHGTAEDAKEIIPMLRDEDAVVRWEAAKALQKIHHEGAVGPLIQLVGKDLDADVRMAAATALGQYRQPRVYQALVGALEDHVFGVVEAAQESLKTLTGQDLGADGRDWLTWSRGHWDDLFAAGGAYTWLPYTKHRSWWDKIQFWKPSAAATPLPPKGLEPQPDTSAADAG